MIVLRARHQRNVLIRPIQEVVHNKDLIQTLRPIDTFVIGVLANKDRNSFKDLAHNNIHHMRRLKNKDCAVKLSAILQIAKINFDRFGHETISIYSPTANKEVDVSITELFANKAIFYGLDPLQSIVSANGGCDINQV